MSKDHLPEQSEPAWFILNRVCKHLGEGIINYHFYYAPQKPSDRGMNTNKPIMNEFRSSLDLALEKENISFPRIIITLLKIIPFNPYDVRNLLQYCIENRDNLSPENLTEYALKKHYPLIKLIISGKNDYRKEGEVLYMIQEIAHESGEDEMYEFYEAYRIIKECLKDIQPPKKRLIQHAETNRDKILQTQVDLIGGTFSNGIWIPGRLINGEIESRVKTILLGSTIAQVMETIKKLEDAVKNNVEVVSQGVLSATDLLSSMQGNSQGGNQYNKKTSIQIKNALQDYLNFYLDMLCGMPESEEILYEKEEILSSIFGQEDLLRRFFRFHFSNNHGYNRVIDFYPKWSKTRYIQNGYNYRHSIDLDIENKQIVIRRIYRTPYEEASYIQVPEGRIIDLNGYILKIDGGIILNNPESFSNGELIYDPNSQSRIPLL